MEQDNNSKIEAVIKAVSPDLWKIIEMLGERDKAAHNLRALRKAVEKIHETPYGNISFNIRTHNSYITDVTWQAFQRERFEIEKKP